MLSWMRRFHQRFHQGSYQKLLWLAFLGSLSIHAAPTSQTPLIPINIASSLSHTRLSQQIEQQLSSAYLALGYQLIVHRLPAGRSLRMANQGEFDGELFRISAAAAQFPQLIAVPYPLARIQLHAFVLADPSKDWQQWQQNPQLKVAYVRGFRLAEQYPFAGSRIAVNTVQQAAQLLAQQKADLLLEDNSSIETLQLIWPRLTPLPPVLAEAQLFHFLHKKHQSLIPALATQLASAEQVQSTR